VQASWWSRVAAVVVFGALAVQGAVGATAVEGAQALPVERVGVAGPVVASADTEFGQDSDGDTIPDEVERVVCGSAACAVGLEDTDGDGIPD
jgi:hypothetical protein